MDGAAKHASRAEHTGFLRGPSAARDERDKTRSPWPPGPGPTGQLGLSIYLWSSLCMYRSHFRLQIKSRDNQPGWTRTLQGRGAASQPGPLRPGIHSLHRIFLWRGCGGSNRVPTPREARWEGETGRGGVFSCGKPHGCHSPPSPVQLHPSFPSPLHCIRSTSSAPGFVFPRSLIINNEEPLLPRSQSLQRCAFLQSIPRISGLPGTEHTGWQIASGDNGDLENLICSHKISSPVSGPM